MTGRDDGGGGHDGGRRFRFPWHTRREIEGELEAELEFHLEQKAAELRASGWSEREARREAVHRFGDLRHTREYCRMEDLRRARGHRRMTLLDEFRQDLRYALRAFRAAPGFTAVALLTLALGIGANTAVFSIVRAVLIESLPLRDPDRLVRVWHGNRSRGIEKESWSEPDVVDIRQQNRTTMSMGAFWYVDGFSGIDLTGQGNPERLSAALVSDGFFETLGTPAARGRTLVRDEHVAGRDRAVVLSHGFWTRRFGGDPSLVGRTITLNGDAFQVVGVMPAGFTYPASRTIDAWLPVSYFGPDQIGRGRGSRFLSVVARMKPGVTASQVTDDLASIATHLARLHPENAEWTEVTTASLRDALVGDVRRPLIVLMAAVALLLLIACVNIASLLLARATGRQQELAVRAAVGAGRGRIARQLLTESLTLAVCGGLAGVGLGLVAVRALAPIAAAELPTSSAIRIDAAVLAFTIAASLVAGLLFGLVPAWRASADLESSLRAGGRGSTGGAGHALRHGLVVAEVALAVILVIGAGLATKSLTRLAAVKTGFDPTHALVVDLSVAGSDGPLAYYRLLEAVRAVPGVVKAGSIRDLPLTGNGETIASGASSRALPDGEASRVQVHHVSTDYFEAIGIPVHAGRSFLMSDDREGQRVVVVNETMARRFWPGEDAVGQTLRLGGAELGVVGVVGDVRQRGLAEPVDAAMYLHVLQQYRSRMSIVVRTSGDPTLIAGAVRQAIWSQDAAQTITSVATLESVLGTAVARPRMLAVLLLLFGAIGLTLGAVGLYGVLAYAVTQRRQEIGLRVALGASRRAVLASILGRGLLLTTIGIAAGSVAALLLTRLMGGILFDIRPSDPATFAQVAIVMLGSALLASWIPARRALAIDPVTALRYE